jgi:transposase
MRKEPAMETIRFVGLDVHAETIAVAVAEAGDGEVRFLGTIPNSPEAVRRLVKKLGPVTQLRACYEAGPCGYVLYWQLAALDVPCEVVAPTLVPVKAGDRVKTDRRDAHKLARCLRAGELTAVWVPDAAHEALRDVLRAREAAKKDQLRARHRLSKFLLRHGLRPPAGVKAWTTAYLLWVGRLEFEHRAIEITHADLLHEVDHVAERIRRLEQAIGEIVDQLPASRRAVVDALQAMRGVARLTAATLVAEIGEFSRFSSPRQLMGYAGIVPREHSSGSRIRRGSITKTGNSHLRRIIIEAAWAYRHRPGVGAGLRRRQQTVAPDLIEIAWKAQNRLHGRYRKLTGREMAKQKVIAAVGRELLGFAWAIAVRAERSTPACSAAAA